MSFDALLFFPTKSLAAAAYGVVTTRSAADGLIE